MDVNGDVKVRKGSSNNANIWFGTETGAQVGALEVQTTASGARLLTRNSDDGSIIFRLGASAQYTAMHLQGPNTRRIGVGHGAPTCQFHVKDSGETLIKVESTASAAGLQIKSSTRQYMLAVNAAGQFHVWDDGANSGRITLAADGNVGIGRIPGAGEARLQIKTEASQSGISVETTNANEVTAVLKGGSEGATTILQLSNKMNRQTAVFQNNGNVGMGHPDYASLFSTPNANLMLVGNGDYRPVERSQNALEQSAFHSYDLDAHCRPVLCVFL